MWICNQKTAVNKEPVWSATVLSLEPLTAMGRGVHKNLCCVKGLNISVGDRVLLTRTASKIYIIAKI